MADDTNNSSRFSLQSIKNAVTGSADESEELSERAATKAMDGSDAQDIRKPFEFEHPDYDRTEAPKDEMRKYWRQFETTPLIRKPITSFASRVTEAGYFIETTKLDEEEVERLGDWLDQAAILEGQPGRDFRLLAKKAIIQREVRGTALIEVAPDRADEDRIAGLKLINPETMEAVTRPTQSILMAPDDIERYENAPLAESGGAAAWLQDVLETDQTQWGRAIDKSGGDADNDKKIGFRRDEIIPLARDADVGEVFGTSRIEAVSDRIDGLKQKLADNDEAIASKAYPLWLFMFGSEENPWDSSDINSFMSAHEMENFHPGMKQGVRGDVSVETISGEVADIAEYLQFDLRWVMSSMPMPMFVLGSFESASVGQVSGVAQQQDVNRQIAEARRELEEEFTPVLRDVARQQGISEDAAKDITLKFGKPGESDLDVDTNQQVIRYVSGSQGGKTQTGGNQQQQQQQQQDGTAPEDTEADDVITKGTTPSDIDIPSGAPTPAGVDEDANPFVDIKTGSKEDGNSEQNSVWDANSVVAELADESAESEIATLATEVFTKARDRTLDSLEERYASTPKFAVAEFENVANRELNQAVRESNLTGEAKTLLTEELSDISKKYSSGDFNKFTSQQNTRFYAQNIENAVRDATEEMLRRARLQVRRGVVNGESWNEVRSRVEQDYNDAYLAERASLIGRMELKNAIESTKLQEFEQADDIVGFRVSNERPSTALTKELNGVEVRFDETDSVREEMRSRLDATPEQGFRPLPQVPPFHFNDTTTIEPIRGE